MRYPLFVSDFDGTLVRADGTISPETIRAIAAYRRAGGKFAVCTGRMLSSIRPRLRELGLEEGVVVAFQGATVADIATGTLLKDEGFTEEAAVRVTRFLEERGLHVHIYTTEALYANRDDALLAAYERVCGVKAQTEDLLFRKIGREHLRVVKVLAMCEPAERNAVKALVEGELGGEFFITCSSGWLVEIMPKGQSKGEAIGFLSDHYGIPREQIAAIGDEENDLPMLLAAGGRFAVENAAQILKNVAQTVPSVEEDGVAYALWKYAMGD